ncbi:MAG: universal stress protein [Holophagales bacterium]|nr:universal stress protein [Holophagales bacterium]
MMAARENALLRSIVVGTDFSVCAARALAHAVSLAQLSGAKIHLVHVLLEPVQALDVAAALPYPDVEVRKEWEQAARVKLDREVKAAEKRGVATTAEIRWGRPSDTIVDTAARQKASLIVLGRRPSGSCACRPCRSSPSGKEEVRAGGASRGSPARAARLPSRPSPRRAGSPPGRVSVSGASGPRSRAHRRSDRRSRPTPRTRRRSGDPEPPRSSSSSSGSPESPCGRSRSGWRPPAASDPSEARRSRPGGRPCRGGAWRTRRTRSGSGWRGRGARAARRSSRGGARAGPARRRRWPWRPRSGPCSPCRARTRSGRRPPWNPCRGPVLPSSREGLSDTRRGGSS